ncbi:MAG TPA: SGNH hydrolase domain-containing protein [Acidimicrobiales bacterium]|nr:SGNH hydrolase domain-containing protein [Acidimicrobiales bacterium]
MFRLLTTRRKQAPSRKLLVGAVAATAVLSSIWGQPATAAANSNTGAPLSGEVVPAARVLQEVQAAQTLRSVPEGVARHLTSNDEAGPGFDKNLSCHSVAANKANVPSYAFGACSYGDLNSSKLMVVYGDSHAPMWAEALEYIALRAGWRLVTYYLWNCPVPNLSYISSQTNSPNKQCSEFHSIAPSAIDALHAQLVVITSEAGYQQVKRGVVATAAQWQAGWTKVIDSLRQAGTRVVVLGDIPQWSDDYAYCLAAHMGAVQSCASLPKDAIPVNVPAEQKAASVTKVQYISPEPWICAHMCEPVISGIRVFNDEYHLTGTYVEYLSGALQQALGLPDTAKS